jgi:NAD(P)-dependent dehydrogenase (short-subunit alcohol dehydrogenase family)
MNLHLEGKRAFVSGSSSGIGAGIARKLAQEGAIVVVHGRSEEKARKVAKEIGHSGGQVFVALGDLSTDEGAVSATEQALKLLGGLDILVNNAGGADGPSQGWSDATLANWIGLFEQNFFSAVRLIRHFAPALRAAGWGRIVNIATGWAMRPAAVMPHYAAAKAALAVMSRRSAEFSDP